jgi:hypothetical protein
LEIWEDVVTNFDRMTRRKCVGFTKTNSCVADYTDYEAILAVTEAGNQSGTLQPQAGRELRRADWSNVSNPN